MDLRSASAREAGKTIQIMAQVLQDDFEGIANKLITKDSLIKLVHCGTKVLAEIGNQTIISILNYVCVPKVIQKFQEEMKTSKNTWAHAKISGYLFQIMQNYPFEQVILKQLHIIEPWMQQALSDANPEARQAGRKAFLLYEQYAPYEADQLYKMLDYQVQRAIYDDRTVFENKSDTQNKIQLSKSYGNSNNLIQSNVLGQTQVNNFVLEAEKTQKYERERSQKRPSTAKQLVNSDKKMKTPMKSSGSRRSNQSPTSSKSASKIKLVSLNYPQAGNTQTIKSSGGYTNPFNANVENFAMTNQAMTDHSNSQQVSMDKLFIKMKNNSWQLRVEAFQELMTYLVDLDHEQLSKILKKEKTFPLIVNISLQYLMNEQTTKVVEVSMDLVEFLLTQMPEMLFNHIENIVRALLRLISTKKDNMNLKGQELLQLVMEVLTPNVILPNLVGILEEISDDNTQIPIKLSGLDTLCILLKEAKLSEQIQFESTVQIISQILQNHSSQKQVQISSLKAIQILRDKNVKFTLESINLLSNLQQNILKQVANVFDRNLAKQIINYQEDQSNYVSEQYANQYQNQNLNHQSKQKNCSVVETTAVRTQEASNKSLTQNNNQSTPVLQNFTNKTQRSPIKDQKSKLDERGANNKENSAQMKQKQPLITTLNQFSNQTQISSNQTMTDESVNIDFSNFSMSTTIPTQNSIQSNLISQVISIYSIFMDNNQSQTNKIQSFKSLSKIMKSNCPSILQDVWQPTFESLIDSLFSIMCNKQDSPAIKDLCIRTISDLIAVQTRERLNQLSMKVMNLKLRDKLLHQTLQIYTSSLEFSGQVVTHNSANDPADQILDSLAKKCESQFLVQSICPLFAQIEPPKLQAIIRMVMNRVRIINTGEIEGEFKIESYQHIAQNLVQMADYFYEIINNQNADVRKCTVFCLVEIQAIIGDDYFQAFTGKLNPSQQKLVDIYIKKRLDSIQQEQMRMIVQ
ncbi:clip-associating protein [Stylonychia lemnae]|uniref:Clip-associating protein n=1 Tax=Stylonychia lemnae TaxID=5949 RepID=A0A078BBN7_STYLE|nr:clip-associating protein [Stylonychia lemnae]|eukprot:CDW90677.1 clip-associating protein [Stylonychia lemnae]